MIISAAVEPKTESTAHPNPTQARGAVAESVGKLDDVWFSIVRWAAVGSDADRLASSKAAGASLGPTRMVALRGCCYMHLRTVRRVSGLLSSLAPARRPPRGGKA
jgi:hypothetical protein